MKLWELFDISLLEHSVFTLIDFPSSTMHQQIILLHCLTGDKKYICHLENKLLSQRAC